MLVFSMSAAFVSAKTVEAGNMEFDEMVFPRVGTDGDYFRDISVHTMGPMAKAADGALWVYVESSLGDDDLFRSTRDGDIESFFDFYQCHLFPLRVLLRIDKKW